MTRNPKKAEVIRVVEPLSRRSDRIVDPRADRLPALMRLRVLWSVSQRASDRATYDRRGPGVSAYVGPNGGGKTLCAVQDLLPALYAGKPVWSNTPLVDPRDHGRAGTSFPSYHAITHADQLLEIDGGAEVLLDEIATVANSRESQRLDPRFQIAFHQLRKRGARVLYTAPDFARADLIFREVTQVITECRGFAPDRQNALDQWGLPDPWAPRRVFRRETFDAQEFTQWTAGKRDKAEVLTREWSYPAKLRIDPRQAYFTLQGVDKIAGVLVDGNCAHCGKKAKAEYCKGHTDAEVHDLAAARALEDAGAAGRHALAIVEARDEVRA